jgi:Domain of unknown function (DUF5667)
MITSSDQISDILDTCLERVRGGETVAACLHDYPQFANELAPLLIAVDNVRQAPPPQLRPAARQAIQRQLRSAVAGRAPRRAATNSWSRMPALRFAGAMIALVLAIGGGTAGVSAAQSSLPGSPLYPIKRAGEELRLNLTPDPAGRAVLHMDFARARLAETLALLDSQRPADERVLNDLANEYDLAWANIQLLPAGEAQVQRERFIAEGQAEVAALAEATEHAPLANRPAFEAALRAGQATLNEATRHNSPAPPEDSAGDRQPTTKSPVPPTNSQGQGTGKGQGNGQGQGNGNSPGQDRGNSQGNSGGYPTPDPGNQPGDPSDSGQNGGKGQGQGQGQPNEPANGQTNGNGQGQGNGNSPGQDRGNSQGNSGGHPTPDPGNQPGDPSDSGQNGGKGQGQGQGQPNEPANGQGNDQGQSNGNSPAPGNSGDTNPKHEGTKPKQGHP